jgi:pimeloyl-ACP methyl ester carboxylesterase
VELNTDDVEFALPSGRLYARRVGTRGRPVVLAVHGLSANLWAFDTMAPAIASRGTQVVSFDLRGRGASEVTPPGSYGIDRHASDVLAVADRLDASDFGLVGWSLGAMIAMRVARIAPRRVRRLVLIDHVGRADPRAVAVLYSGLARLETPERSALAYVEAQRASGLIEPWHDQWEHLYRHELTPGKARATPRTARRAALEDLEDAATADDTSYWAELTMPTLLVRATAPLGGGLLVPDGQLQAIRRVLPQLQVFESHRNHFGATRSGSRRNACPDRRRRHAQQAARADGGRSDVAGWAGRGRPPTGMSTRLPGLPRRRDSGSPAGVDALP